MKAQNHLAYRFVYDSLTRKYSGITYEEKDTNTTDIPPHFEAGYVTLFDTINEKWTLVSEFDFYSKVENRYTPTARTEYATTQSLEKINELEKIIFKTHNDFEMVKSQMNMLITIQNRMYEKFFPAIDGLRVLLNNSFNEAEDRIQQHQKILMTHHNEIFLTTCNIEEAVYLVQQNQKPIYLKIYEYICTKLKK